MLAFGPFRPDVAETNPGVSRYARNANLRNDAQGVSYHPRRSLQVVPSSEALPDAPRGAIAVVAKSGAFKGYFGTEAELYSLDSDFGFTEIGNGYSLPTGHSWGMCQYGDHLIVTNTADGMLDWDIESGGTVDAIADAPKARVVFFWAEMVIALDCDGDNRMMRNSAPGTYSNWTTRGAQKSPFGDGEALMGGGVVGAGPVGNAVIVQRAGTHILSTTGTSSIFRRDRVSDFGAVNPECIVQAPGALYFWDSSGPVEVTGQGIKAIGEGKIARTYAEIIDESKLSGAYDPERRQVVWRIDDANLLTYDIPTGEFMPVSENTAAIVRMGNTAQTLEDLDDFGTLDSLPYSLDSAAWQGGKPRLAALDADLKFGFFDGSFLPATVDTATLTDRVSMLVSWCEPVTDADDVLVTLGVRDRLADAVTWKDPAAMVASGRVPQRGRGKAIVQRVTIPASSGWSYLRGIEFPPGAIVKGGPK